MLGKFGQKRVGPPKMEMLPYAYWLWEGGGGMVVVPTSWKFRRFRDYMVSYISGVSRGSPPNWDKIGTQQKNSSLMIRQNNERFLENLFWQSYYVVITDDSCVA